MRWEGPHRALGRSEVIALGTLLLVATAQRAWNACTLPPLTGYDAPGHAGYILTIVAEHRLPHPLEGWSTFHPPAYYLLASLVWRLLEPFGPRTIDAGIRAIGSLAGIGAGLVSYLLVRRLGGSPRVAWVAAALVLFVPCAQLAAAMEGNEALAAGLAALALPGLVTLQRNPRRLRAAAASGLFTGLALATKFSALPLLAACAVPFARADADRAALRTAAVMAVAGLLVAGPVYLRNISLTGSLVPMTRDIGPMRKAEANLVLRPRLIRDYLWI
ncbi:MAG TPA: glycosyltransferase family 39 protein, partial [Candidatus Bathyarchaeia archaeon]|nr:glycosyltransferase family 39 protein [Candidatus Bathyarchaeia archaeon]